MASGLVWHILHPPQEAKLPDAVAGALSPASGELKPDIKA
jgi:hypothetical protein